MAEDSPASSCVVNSDSGSGSGFSTPLPEPTPSPAAYDDSSELKLENEMTIDICKRLMTAMVDECRSNDRLIEACAPQKCKPYEPEFSKLQCFRC